jgi:dolichyl-phosphate beta-glucosyltransferase
MTGHEALNLTHAPNHQPIPLQLSLVIPAFNEEHRLPAGFARLSKAIADGAISPESTEVILVDDGSTDATSECARSLMASLPNVNIIRLESNTGKGAAVRAGVMAAMAPYIIFADADMAIDPSQTPRFIEELKVADLAIGSRAASGSSVDRSSVSRSMMNRIFNRLVNAVTRVSLDDTQCGFKGFRAPAAKLLFHCMTTERMAFDVEMLLMARRLGLRINQVPVHWLRVKGSHVSPLVDTVSMVFDVLRVRRIVRRMPLLQGFLVNLSPPSGGATDHVDGYAYLRNLSAFHPVIRREDGTYLVLLPLMDEAEVKDQIEEMTRQLGGVAPMRTAVSVDSLCSLAPLRLSWDDATVTLPSH